MMIKQPGSLPFVPARLTGWRRDVRWAISLIVLLSFMFTTVVSVCCIWGAMDPQAEKKGIATSVVMLVGGASLTVWLTMSNQIEETF